MLLVTPSCKALIWTFVLFALAINCDLSIVLIKPKTRPNKCLSIRCCALHSSKTANTSCPIEARITNCSKLTPIHLLQCIWKAFKSFKCFSGDARHTQSTFSAHAQVGAAPGSLTPGPISANLQCLLHTTCAEACQQSGFCTRLGSFGNSV